MTVFDWDASDFDWGRGPMNLAAAKADGLTWFTHKATESTNTTHVRMREALERALGAGFAFLGAYHVIRSSPSVQSQINFFLGYLDQQVPWWRGFPGFMLQVDLELWPYDQVSAATGVAFANALQAQQPKRVLTYASRGMYGNSLGGIVTPLWNASYGNDPAVGYRQAYPGDGGVGWTAYSGQVPPMWQYGSRVTIGTQPGCDGNAFRGSIEDLRLLITGSTGEDMTPEEHAWLQETVIRMRATDNRVREGILNGASTMDDVPGEGPGRPVQLVRKIEQILATVTSAPPIQVDASAVAAALVATPAFRDAIAAAVRAELNTTRLTG